MITSFKRLILALSVAVFSLTGAALAQTSSSLPEPASPEKAKIEDGKINVYIGTPRVNGYGIGDSIPVTVVFEMIPAPAPEPKPAKPVDTADGASGKPERAPEPKLLAVPQVDVEGLKMQIQSAEALDVEMLTAATEVTRYSRDGKEYLKVVFYVWQFVTTKQTQVDVKADFMYATRQLEDGQPDWRKASTPAIHVGIRKTATDNQTKLQEGDLTLKTSPRAAAASWFLVGGPVFFVPLVIGLGLFAYRRYMEPKKLSANEEAWLVLDRVIEAGSKAGAFTLAQYEEIFFALRKRFGVLDKDGDELFAALRKREDLASVNFADVERVFGIESVFYAKTGEITAEQQKSFIEGIKLIVPRH